MSTARRVLTWFVLFIAMHAVSIHGVPASRKPYLVSSGEAEVVDALCERAAASNTPWSKCLMRLRVTCKRRYRGKFLHGFSALMSQREMERLAECVGDFVDVEEDVEVYSLGMQSGWALDRMNQRALPLDGRVLPREIGVGNADDDFGDFGSPLVSIYVLDTGVRRTHVEFSDQRVRMATDLVDDDNDPSDCDGHGTHTASTIASVAYSKRTIVHVVRVLDCHGNGELSSLIAGLDFVAREVYDERRRRRLPAVVSLALGVRRGVWSKALERAVMGLIDEDVLVITAAGNQRQDACQISPANVAATLTVGASDEFDALYAYSNTGPCVDLFAPGVNILGACGGETSCATPSDTAYSFQSGTSMAVAHAVGVASRILTVAPNMTATDLKRHLIATATQGVITGDMLPGTPNRLIYVR